MLQRRQRVKVEGREVVEGKGGGNEEKAKEEEDSEKEGREKKDIHKTLSSLWISHSRLGT